MNTDDRLLTFEIAGSIYALPIAGVIEVAEGTERACIPTIPRGQAGVVNHHGDALPVVDRALLLDLPACESPAGEHLLMVSERPAGGARLGLPVDRVLGLVEGRVGRGRPRGGIAARRTIDGRMVNILDPESLVSRARQVIARATTSD